MCVCYLTTTKNKAFVRNSASGDWGVHVISDDLLRGQVTRAQLAIVAPRVLHFWLLLRLRSISEKTSVDATQRWPRLRLWQICQCRSGTV